MAVPPTTSPPPDRLCAAPTFALAYAMDGRPFVAKDVEPYTQFWISERERTLLTLFPARRGRTAGEAVDAYLRLSGETDTPRRRTALIRTIAQMQAAGVLCRAADDTSRYDAGMAANYMRHRPIPCAVTDHIIAAGGIGPNSQVLDLAGGPGSLSLPLARASDRVSLMELSRGFVAAARAQARREGLNLATVHESCNRLAQHDGAYDAITVSQALHWLDDVAVCRGVCRLLREGGSFFVVHSALDLADDHPLSFVLGDRTPLGDKVMTPFPAQVAALHRRLALLLHGLDSPDVQRIDPLQLWGEPGVTRPSRIAAAGAWLLQEDRDIGAGFARAFLSPEHVRQFGESPEAFWNEVERRCAEATARQRLGRQHWAVLQFRRGASRSALSGASGLTPLQLSSLRALAAA